MARNENEILHSLIQGYVGSRRLSPVVLAELEHIARGELARQVADSRGVSYHAVRCRRARLFRSLQVSGAGEVMAGLLSLSLGKLAQPEPRGRARA